MRRPLLLLLLLVASGAGQAAVVFEGCWANAVGPTRALPFRAAASELMTPELCAQMAATRQVSSWGLEWGRECWLDPADSDLATLTRLGARANCTFPCTGNAAKTCGGDFTVDLFIESQPAAATLPTRNDTLLGCFRDDQLNRRMPSLLWASNNSMTLELCGSIAYAEQHEAYAVQWGTECWGSSNVTHAQSLGLATDCDMPCSGNASQVCGGALALQMYNIRSPYWLAEGYVKPPPPGVPLPSPSPLPAPAPGGALGGGVSLLTGGAGSGQPGAASAAGSTAAARALALLLAGVAGVALAAWVPL